MQTVYAHEVLYSRFEGGWIVKAIYATKKAAWLAMRLALVEQFNKAREEWFLYGRSVYERGDVWQYQDCDQQRVKSYVVNTAPNKHRS